LPDVATDESRCPPAESSEPPRGARRGRPPAAPDTALATLERVAPRMHGTLVALPLRRDVRRVRAALLVLLLSARCPLDGVAQRSWYEPGAVVRLGCEGLRRLWEARWPAAPAPSLRRTRDHVNELERSLLLVRAPGERLPQLRVGDERSERVPRWPDTFHLLESEEAATWWSEHGATLLALHPGARVNPAEWRRHFADWRKRRPRQQELFAELGRALCSERRGADGAALATIEDLRSARALELLAKKSASVDQAIAALDRLGVVVRGKNRQALATDGLKVRGAMVALARALRAGRRVENRPGFLVAAWRRVDRRNVPRELEGLAAG
jgi:hypothetical protein